MNGVKAKSQKAAEEKEVAAPVQEEAQREFAGNLIEADNGLKADLTTAVMSYCSFIPQTIEEKTNFFNAINNPTAKLRDAVNMELKLKHVYAESVDFVDEDGEITPGVRMVLITEDGKSYQTASIGVYNCLKKMFGLFGEPNVWKKPITIVPQQVSKKANRVVMTFNVKP